MRKLFLTTLLICFCFELALAQEPELAPADEIPAVEEAYIDHSLSAIIDPSRHRITVTDQITVPPSLTGSVLQFSLNRNLRIINASETYNVLVNTAIGDVVPGNTDSTLISDNTDSSVAPSMQYRVTLPAGESVLELTYSGTIYDLAEQNSEEYAQSFSETTGIIGDEGVFLSKASVWVPEFNDDLLTFSMQVRFSDTASQWSAVSQGEESTALYTDINGEHELTVWRAQHPMEEVYLIAGNFTYYEKQIDDVTASVYLRNPEPNLASKYLDATERYLLLYEPLLGEYPYSKFALIENFWETGYGMPSFTLLGEQVIRFPFILESSYPHELLHNWWGNGVYPDYGSGNWSEGLTAYLADHLFQEMEGLGSDYRKEMLARYKNYVAAGSDFPLAEFTSRKSAASQAVGYGKTLMLWHMLRVELGDELFLTGLRKFYKDYQFQRASFADIEQLFSEISGLDLSTFFSQWVNRTGAPELTVNVEEVGGNRARIIFAQTQADQPYQLKVPVALYYEDQAEPQMYDIALSQRIDGVMADDYDKLTAVLVDPYFDVFRTLDREETPPTIGELFGANEIAFVLPDSNREHWATMARSFAEGHDALILNGSDLAELPSDRSVWLLGRDNPLLPSFIRASENYGLTMTDTSVEIAGSSIAFDDRASVAVARHPANAELALGWIHVQDMIAMPGMIEKLPHYGKYSYLSFLGAEPTNDVKGVWASSESPLRWVKNETAGEVNWQAIPAVPAITTLPPKYLPEQLMRHAHELSSASMQGRGLGTAGLDEAARYIADQFRRSGLQTADGTYLQQWSEIVPGLGVSTLQNVVAILPGSDRSLSNQPVILGAHYDHLGVDSASNSIYPGADDNASGISVLIEVANKLARGYTPARPIVFVAFSGEESGLLGSRHFVNEPPGNFAADEFFAMINLDAVGRLESKPLQIFATESAYEWPFMAQGIGFTIGVASSFPAETIASSDHISFLNAGIPAIHLFSGAHSDYHRSSDTADKLDASGMSDVALWVEEAMVYLGDRREPLRVNLEGANKSISPGNASAREASLGTVPDFAYAGVGVRISAVTPDSAAETAGLIEGDILRSYDGEPLVDLQSYSNLLRGSAAGDTVTLEILRGSETLNIQATLNPR